MTGKSRKADDPPEILAFVEWMRAHRYTDISIKNMMHKVRKVYKEYPQFEGLPQYTDDLSYLYQRDGISHSAVAQYRRTYNRLYDFLEDVYGTE